MSPVEEPADVVLIGGGIMSATLAALLSTLEPSWRIEILERRAAVAEESSGAWNNAGTGHAALCELNYTPERADGSIDIAKAVRINEQFSLSRELWEHLRGEGRLPADGRFVTPTPHLTFVRGAQDVDYLRRRYEALVAHPRFAGLRFTDDPAVLRDWAPLVMRDRAPGESVAATRADDGVDVDYGTLTRQLFDDVTGRGARLHLQHEVRDLRREDDGTWRLLVRDLRQASPHPRTLRARFVFVGAGGGALTLLQKSGIPEIRGFGGFPISGQFLRTTDPGLVAQHRVKVYGKAAVGSPPMSVPHLDARTVDGGSALLFGPYAGWSMKFLKHGSWLDLVRTIRPDNVLPLLAVAAHNINLVSYLVREVLASPAARLRTLREFMPSARAQDWELITAGQRVQVIKRDPRVGGVLEFGTELVTAADGSIAGLLGASPGASTAASAMLDLLGRCFPQRMAGWSPRLEAMMPSLTEAGPQVAATQEPGTDPDIDPEVQREATADADDAAAPAASTAQDAGTPRSR